MNTALEYSTRVVQEGGRRCKEYSYDLVHLTPLRIPLMNPPSVCVCVCVKKQRWAQNRRFLQLSLFASSYRYSLQ